MSKVANTYWDNSQTTGNKRSTATRRKAAAERKSKRTPQWAAFAIIVTMTSMIALAINFRAYSTMSKEASQHDVLNTQIENLTTENLALQDEIHNIKSDSRTIEREARKIGLSRSEEKVPLPAN